MPVLPASNIAMIEWFEQRVAGWVADPTAIGLTAGQATDLLAQTGAARAAYQASQQARNASKTSTLAFHQGASGLRSDGADLIKTIKAFAEATDDENVYVLAEVPPPADPEPQGPPGQPEQIAASLNNDGLLRLSWKADNAASSSGAYFMVHRKLDGEAGFTLAGGASGKDFTDAKIPLGTASATYKIYAHRGDLVSDSSLQFTVQFGVNIPGPGGEASEEEGLSEAA